MIAVTGLTGHSGGFLLKQFADNGYDGRIRALVRESTDTGSLLASGLDVEIYKGDILSVECLKGFVSGAYTIIHIAGIWRSLSILEAVRQTGGDPHIILVHTTGIYSKHKMASEEYKQIEADMQKYLDMGMNITILRPTMIFGDMRDHNISKYIRMVDRLPFMPEIDKGRGLIQPVNARDLGQAYYKAAMHTRLPQLEYIVSGQRQLSLHELTTLIGRFLGKKTRHISAPMGLGVFGAKLIKLLSFGKKDLVEKVLRMGEDRVFPNDDARRDFGFDPEPFDQGLEREVKEFLASKEG